jgi:diguanylate cyclase (GGDEF)-like protein
MKALSLNAIRYKKLLQERLVLYKEVRMYERLMESMRADNSFEDILRHLVQAVTKGLGYDRAGIFLADWDRNIGQRVIGIDQKGNLEWSGKEYLLTPVRGANWVSDIVHGYNKAYYTNNRQKKIKNSRGEDGDMVKVFCNALVPITVSGEKIIGIIAVDNLFTSRRLKKSDLLSLSNFATQAGLVIESYRQHQKIKDITIKDWLTGVYNRRYFDNYMPKEVIRCRRYKRMLGLLYVDLDHFKHINDTYGHPAGDQIIKQVARTMVEQLRDVDVVARLGGDEFAVLLPEVGPVGTKTVAERLLRAIRELVPPVEGMQIAGEKITVSMGLAALTEEIENWHELVKAADQSLYQAKIAGRNRMGEILSVSETTDHQKQIPNS